MTDSTSLVGKDLSNRDLRSADLSGKVLFGVNLTGSKLRGARISLDCATFDGATFDDDQVAMLLKMLTHADISQQWVLGLNQLVEQVTGTDRANAIDRIIGVT